MTEVPIMMNKVRTTKEYFSMPRSASTALLTTNTGTATYQNKLLIWRQWAFNLGA
eukprot:CAMPEP_0194699742 /NCGR_PEP_ID=MMETSP0295-20121207/25044_1 /TAXON_ID=39354 /ORGANISM="Heterosigma akashiwo, Strain CCMP2393" /LENGTH=54 /DNA_ID=CAMNT_0039593345 /DNA_START=537 /DNA_END=701 /DNA_ORIENTATION=-